MATDDPIGSLERRLDALERENARLRRQLPPELLPEDPAFNPTAFRGALMFYQMLMYIPFALAFGGTLLLPKLMPGLTRITVAGISLFDMAGMGTNHPGFGFGIIACGGLALGVIAAGGGAVGGLAIGGGAVGIVALGGGAFGLFAFGGGAIGYVAIGGGALGRYVLAGSGRGRAVFSFRRQDREAVELFTRYLPRFRDAMARPLPVVPVETDPDDPASQS
ncbi:MAG: hypothetical protein JXA69_13320 [Phycisphaerae bacterium]|nr:hypothetical protein [Phycisphaerae bacterium]